MNKVISAVGLMALMYLFPGSAPAAEPLWLYGRVSDGTSRKPIDFATVAVLEKKISAKTDMDGFYSIELPEPGLYTVIVTFSGLEPLTRKINIGAASTAQDFILYPAKIRGATLTIREDRRKQKISRQTMTIEEMKKVPATFGDSLGALTTLPGIIKTGGMFGNLVLRGVSPFQNRYYIDDIPVQSPQHFGGIHSVISNDLLGEIDVYSSSFPAEFGNALGGVIKMNTLDDVSEFGGYTDMNIISSNVLIKVPWTAEGENGEVLKRGYMIAAGRYGYTSLIVPKVYDLLYDQQMDFVYDYWDYQFKGKYFLNSSHALTLFVFGSSDYVKFVVDKSIQEEIPAKEREKLPTLFFDFDVLTDQQFHSQSLAYTYEPSGRLQNKLLFYTSLNSAYTYFSLNDVNIASWLKDNHRESKPDTYTLKDKFRFEWIEGIAEMELALEAHYYNFTLDGIEIRLFGEDTGFVDFTDEDSAVKQEINKKFTNQSLGGYFLNRFTFGGLTFVPGIRADYLHGTGAFTYDPRAMLSYEFPSETIIALAGGKYSTFLQVNPYQFTRNSEFASFGGEVEPEKAWHASAGIEQKFLSLYMGRLEGFYNYLYDLYIIDEYKLEDGTIHLGGNTGIQKAWGAEVLLRKDTRQGLNDWFGWLSYTFTQSKYKSGKTVEVYNDYGMNIGDPNGGRFINYSYEQEHSVKMIGGYRHNSHEIGARLEWTTAFPYTPYVDSVGIYIPQSGRTEYYPVSSTDVNSQRLSSDLMLTLRYSHKTSYEWGHLSWYIELIDLLGVFFPNEDIEWDFSKPYSAGGADRNPLKRTPEPGERIDFIPNLGVEVKF